MQWYCKTKIRGMGDLLIDSNQALAKEKKKKGSRNTLTKNVSSIASVAPIMRSSSHELSHVRQAKRASIYNALAGSEFRIDGVKLIISDWKTSGSAGGENTSMLVYCNEGVFWPLASQPTKACDASLTRRASSPSLSSSSDSETIDCHSSSPHH